MFSLIFAVIIVVLVLAALVFFNKRKAKTFQHKQTGDRRKIYVGNLDYKVYDDELKAFFSQFGQVEEVRVVKNSRTGRSKGFAFITFVGPDEANRSLVGHGQLLKGRALVVRIAKDK